MLIDYKWTTSPHGVVPVLAEQAWFTKKYGYLKHGMRTLHIVDALNSSLVVAYTTPTRMLDATTRKELYTTGKKIQQDISVTISQARLLNWADNNGILVNRWILDGKKIRLASTPSVGESLY